jgi:hypothetical protein
MSGLWRLAYHEQMPIGSAESVSRDRARTFAPQIVPKYGI